MTAASPLEALERLTEGAPHNAADDDGIDERPIFLLATGWRTGSTLLQRLLVTDPSVLLWGEPLGRMALVPRLVEMLSCISSTWPPPHYWVDAEAGEGEPEELSKAWIANTFPPAAHLRTGLRQLFLSWLRDPALARGYSRWGLKEVRLGAHDAQLLRWLFPKAEFVVVVRDPRDAFMSAAGVDGKLRYVERYPEGKVESPSAFARHWNRLATSWVGVPPEFGHVVCRYEDLVAGRFDCRELEQRLGLELREELALGHRVGGTTPDNPHLKRSARLAISWHAREGLRAYGYR